MANLFILNVGALQFGAHLYRFVGMFEEALLLV